MWEHVYLQMMDDAEKLSSAKWQDRIIENLMAKQMLLSPGVASCHTQAELDAYNKKAVKPEWTTACTITLMQNRATELRAQADTHSTGSEFARMKYSFAASELEKMAEQLKDK